MKIAPSILAADMTDLKNILHGMDPSSIDLIHMDVMDGHFVPTLSFGELYSAQVESHTSIPLDIHLMVSLPEVHIPHYLPGGKLKNLPYNVTFHLEATHFPVRLSKLIREAGVKCGIALNPGTPLVMLDSLYDHVDLILLMSVEPGFYGQSFIESVVPKIRTLREKIGDRKIEIQVDGGVSPANVKRLYDAGVDIAVAGSAAFKGGLVNENVRAIKKAASG